MMKTLLHAALSFLKSKDNLVFSLFKKKDGETSPYMYIFSLLGT